MKSNQTFVSQTTSIKGRTPGASVSGIYSRSFVVSQYMSESTKNITVQASAGSEKKTYFSVLSHKIKSCQFSKYSQLHFKICTISFTKPHFHAKRLCICFSYGYDTLTQTVALKHTLIYSQSKQQLQYTSWHSQTMALTRWHILSQTVALIHQLSRSNNGSIM